MPNMGHDLNPMEDNFGAPEPGARFSILCRELASLPKASRAAFLLHLLPVFFDALSV